MLGSKAISGNPAHNRCLLSAVDKALGGTGNEQTTAGLSMRVIAALDRQLKVGRTERTGLP
jgi:hypothetical protein